ncbi:MAG: ParB/RepB/Spo0J family partition protein [Rhodospirillaceae bacterium]
MARKLDLSNASQFKRALGRTGIGVGDNNALFGLSSRLRYREILLANIESDPGQPRRNAREADIGTLAASIEQKGLLQPINVRETEPDRFVIVTGERRYWAFRELGRETIPALVIETDDTQALALIENVQRLDLHPVDLAVSLQRLIVDKGLVQEQAAVLIGKSQEYIARLLGILRLPPRILAEAPGRPDISVSLLMELAELGDEALQLSLWQRTGEALTVKTVRAVKQSRPAPADPSFERVLRALRTGIGRMQSFAAGGAVLDEGQRQAMRALRDQLTSMLGE